MVGFPRSGTTLLRVMLDRHPRLAVPPESHFVVFAPRWLLSRSPALAIRHVLAHPRFRAWGLDPGHVRCLVTEARPRTYNEVVRAVFAAYAASQDKPRWGDKTPLYVKHMGTLAREFPDARFVHVIRDGREAAASVAEQDWGEPSAVAAAYGWRRAVGAGRRAGARLGPDRYLEVRLEDLVARPEATLQRVCRFLDEPYAPEMLEYHRDTARREPWASPTSMHRHVLRPPTPGLRDWRVGQSPTQQRAVEAACRRRLAELGYPAPPASLAATVAAWSRWVAVLPTLAASAIRARLWNLAPGAWSALVARRHGVAGGSLPAVLAPRSGQAPHPEGVQGGEGHVGGHDAAQPEGAGPQGVQHEADG